MLGSVLRALLALHFVAISINRSLILLNRLLVILVLFLSLHVVTDKSAADESGTRADGCTHARPSERAADRTAGRRPAPPPAPPPHHRAHAGALPPRAQGPPAAPRHKQRQS